jgi:glutamine---fructose-6-phosphate transaminase (isomerizing)
MLIRIDRGRDMCGIVGYVGRREASPILLDSLSRLEYRGYDSCGIAVRGSAIKVIKDAVRVEALRTTVPYLHGRVGIGHTRWATHGIPSLQNAHPHLDCKGKIAVVHNGVINNFKELRQLLIGENHTFLSDTDTEVIPHLIEKYHRGNLMEAVQRAIVDLEGSYAIGVISEDDNQLIVARKGSPLIIGIGDGENFIASDVPAVVDYANKVIYLENDDIGILSDGDIKIYNHGMEVKREEHTINWGRQDILKSGYDHFMLKEIHEQPRVIRDTIGQFMQSNNGLLSDIKLRDLTIIACGSSYHAGLIGKYIIQDLLGIPVQVDIASEFNLYNRHLVPAESVIISQSGETADVLLSMSKLRDLGSRILVITNVEGSTASRLADHTIFTKAGPEISVAATKSFIAQLIALYQLALGCPEADKKVCGPLIDELRQLPSSVQNVLDNEIHIADCSKFISNFSNVFFIGKGMNYPVALEGALKLKEISYIHAEGYTAGELKHGPFALLSKDTPVIAIVPGDNTYKSMITSIKEVKARSSPVIAFVDETDESTKDLVDMVVKIPHTSNFFSPVVNTVSLQLLSYYAAKYRGCPIDFPRNLAKSVTVE